MDHNGPAEQLNQFFGRSKKNFQNFFYYIKFEKKIVGRVKNFQDLKVVLAMKIKAPFICPDKFSAVKLFYFPLVN